MTDQTNPDDGTLEVPNRFIPSPRARAWIYGVAAALIPLLTITGVLTAEIGGAVLAVVGAALGVAVPTMAAINTPSKK